MHCDLFWEKAIWLFSDYFCALESPAFESGVKCNMADENEAESLPSLRNLTSPEYSKLKNDQYKVKKILLHVSNIFLFMHVVLMFFRPCKICICRISDHSIFLWMRDCP